MRRQQAVAAAMLAGVAVWTLWICLRLSPPILYDDAAISMRYAERMASGAGFTYNDNERVSGASNPLWTALIASGIRMGFGAERTTRALTTLSVVAAVTLAAAVVLETAGPFPALVAGLVLPVDGVWRTQALSGLELPLAIALGLAAVLAASRGRQTLAGVLIGFAILNKLDAGALAVAVVVAWMYVHRELPLRLGAVAAALSAGWLLFAAVYFGSPLPHSMVTKLHQGEVTDFSRFWVMNFFLADWRYLFLLAGLCLLPSFSRAPAKRAVVLVALFLWMSIHALTYSLVPLGDQYPWYLGIPAALAIVVAAISLSVGPPWSVAAAVAIVAASLPHIRETRIRLVSSHTPEVWEVFDGDRRLAGIFLDQFAERDAVVEAASGWVAFESRRPFVDNTGLNSVDARPADYIVLHGAPWQTGSNPPSAPPHYMPLARFDLASKLYPGTTWFTVFGRPSSAIARSARNEAAVDTSRLESDELERLWDQYHRDSSSRGPEKPEAPK